MAKDEIILLPRHKAALKFVEIPSTDISEINNMAEYQALKEFPYSKEEMVISFRNMGSYREGFSYIMLAAVKKQHVEDMIERKKKIPASIRLETEILYLRFFKRRAIKQDKVNLIINIRKDHSEIMIVKGIQPVYTRGFEANDAEALIREIKRSVVSYEADRNNKELEIASIINSSGLSMDNIKSCLEEFLSIPVSFCEDIRGMDDFSMPLEIELLPGEYIDKMAKRGEIIQIFLTCSLFLITVFVLISFFFFKPQ